MFPFSEYNEVMKFCCIQEGGFFYEEKGYCDYLGTFVCTS